MMNRRSEPHPDPVASSGPVTELQQALVDIGSPLQVHAAFVPRRRTEATWTEALRQRPTSYRGTKLWFRYNIRYEHSRRVLPASVEHDERASQVYNEYRGDGYRFDFQIRGAVLAKASSPDLTTVARSIHRWAVDRVTTSQLSDEFDFVSAEDWAPIFEQGREVEWRWTEYAKSIPTNEPWLVDVFEIASNTPELRQLFPFFSMWKLCFSRCTEWPYTYDLPCITPVFP